jgi:hypothetical protein
LVALIPAARAEPLVAYYEATWASLPAGHLVARFDDSTNTFNDELQMDTVGLPHLLLHFRARAESAGQFRPDGAVRPSRYAVDYDLRKYRSQRVRVAYTARDGAMIAERTPDDTNRKPVLGEQYRRDVIDPVAAFATLRRYLIVHGAKPGDHFTLQVFDDVRRFDIAASVVSINAADKSVQVHLDLKAIAGFKKRGDRDAEDAPRPIEVFFRNDDTMLPTRLEISVGFLPLVVRFDHRCADTVHCGPEKKSGATR